MAECDDLPDGDYQSCRGCNAYLTCTVGNMYDDRLCPGNLVWDDIRKNCDWFSHTCKRGDKADPDDDDSDGEFPVIYTSSGIRYTGARTVTTKVMSLPARRQATEQKKGKRFTYSNPESNFTERTKHFNVGSSKEDSVTENSKHYTVSDSKRCDCAKLDRP